MHHTMHRLRGFTLLEIMVVMVIVAVLAAIVTPNLFAGKSRGKDLEREAAMLTARLRVAQDDAMFYGNEYGLVFSENGYRFVRWNAELARFVAPPAVDAWTQRDFAELQYPLSGIGLLKAAQGRSPSLRRTDRSARRPGPGRQRERVWPA